MIMEAAVAMMAKPFIEGVVKDVSKIDSIDKESVKNDLLKGL